MLEPFMPIIGQKMKTDFVFTSVNDIIKNDTLIYFNLPDAKPTVMFKPVGNIEYTSSQPNQAKI